MKKILILGSAGMLGHVVCKYLERLNSYQIYDASYPVKFRKESTILDVFDNKKLIELLEKTSPDIVINCIGVLIKGSSLDPANAIYLNSYFPHYLSKIIKKWNGKLIHISTDCVFSGTKGNYSEFDLKDAADIYGRSKSLGEVINDKDLTLRTSIIGPDLNMNGEGLFHWFMNQSGTINGFTQVFWTGVTTLELARAIHSAIDQKVTGLINLPTKQKISKYNLLTEIKEIYKLSNIQILPTDKKAEDKSLISQRTDFHFKVKEYHEMLLDQFHFMNTNNELYKHYCKKDNLSTDNKHNY